MLPFPSGLSAPWVAQPKGVSPLNSETRIPQSINLTVSVGAERSLGRVARWVLGSVPLHVAHSEAVTEEIRLFGGLAPGALVFGVDSLRVGSWGLDV